jgi:hypothetical protein
VKNVDQWVHKWFGVWREHGPKYNDCPSIREFVAPELVATYDKKRLREYLVSGHMVASASRRTFHVRLPEHGTRGPSRFGLMVNGSGWTISQTISTYMTLQFPTAWLCSIKTRDYEPEPVNEQAVTALEWPPTGRPW